MIIYLDQNKWVELSRIFHGKDSSERDLRILEAFEATRTAGDDHVPISTERYIETARISNVGRKVRLGETMWHFSRGFTLAGYPTIVRHELEVALAKHFPQVEPAKLELIGRGHAHAFGSPPLSGSLEGVADVIEKSLLTGHRGIGISPLSFSGTAQRENFREHLATLHVRHANVPKELRENWLYMLCTIDILNPLRDVAARHRLPATALEALGPDGLKAVLDDMPTRRVDMHLHRQVLKDRHYVAKATDLEDWGGLVVASCYCDVVVCEKHMANMLGRDKRPCRARIETDLARAFSAT